MMAGAPSDMTQAVTSPTTAGAADMPAQDLLLASLTPKELISRLRLKKKIGQGGFAVVYKGTLDKRPVAVKVLLHEHLSPQDGSTAMRMFVREAQALSCCQHPNIVKFYGMLKLPPNFPGLHGFTHSTYAIVEELMTKGSVSDILCDIMSNPFSHSYTTTDAIRWLQQIADALREMHKQSPVTIHRDVKLGNVLLTEEDGHTVAKLADFGLCTRLEASKSCYMVRQGSKDDKPCARTPDTITATLGASSVPPSLPGYNTDSSVHGALMHHGVLHLPPLHVGSAPAFAAPVVSAQAAADASVHPTVIDDDLEDYFKTTGSSLCSSVCDEEFSRATQDTLQSSEPTSVAYDMTSDKFANWMTTGHSTVEDSRGRAEFLLQGPKTFSQLVYHREANSSVDSNADLVARARTTPVPRPAHGPSQSSAGLGSVSSPLTAFGTHVSQFQTVYSLTGLTGSGIYMAPEVFLNEMYNERADVFSFGVLMYEMMARTMLVFTHLHTGKGKQLTTAEQYAEMVSKGYRPPRPTTMDNRTWQLISSCWEADPGLRPSMEYVSQQLLLISSQQSSQDDVRPPLQPQCGCVIC